MELVEGYNYVNIDTLYQPALKGEFIEACEYGPSHFADGLISRGVKHVVVESVNRYGGWTLRYAVRYEWLGGGLCTVVSYKRCSECKRAINQDEADAVNRFLSGTTLAPISIDELEDFLESISD